MKTSEQVNLYPLADKTDVAVVVPATANTIAKLANGIADNFVTSTLVATTAQFMAPAMNEHMWENPATVRNVAEADGKSHYRTSCWIFRRV